MGSHQQQHDQQEFCLKWNNHQSNMLSVFEHLLTSESFVDVTIACDGFVVKAHKVVLSACSPYFRKLLEDNPCQHPIVILTDVGHYEMRLIIEFMYKGEVNVTQEQLSTLLKTAKTLKVKGLTEVNNLQSSDNDDLAACPSPPPLLLPPPLPSIPHLDPVSAPVYRLGGNGSRRWVTTPPSQPPLSAAHGSKSSSGSMAPSSSISKRRRKAGTTRTKSGSNNPSCPSSSSSDKRVGDLQDFENGKTAGVSMAAGHSVLVESIKQEPMPAAPHILLDDDDQAALETGLSGDGINEVNMGAVSCDPLIDVDPDNSMSYSNQDFPAICSERTPTLANDGDGDSVIVEGAQGSSSASIAQDNSSSGGPSTSAEKKPKEKKKTTWTVTDLMSAIESVRSGRMNVLKAAMTFKIPKSSLYDYVNGRSGARLRLMKRIQPLEAMRVFGTSKEYVARALPFLNPERAAAILTASTGDTSWPANNGSSSGSASPPHDHDYLMLQRHQALSEYFSHADHDHDHGLQSVLEDVNIKQEAEQQNLSVRENLSVAPDMDAEEVASPMS